MNPKFDEGSGGSTLLKDTRFLEEVISPSCRESLFAGRCTLPWLHRINKGCSRSGLGSFPLMGLGTTIHVAETTNADGKVALMICAGSQATKELDGTHFCRTRPQSAYIEMLEARSSEFI